MYTCFPFYSALSQQTRFKRQCQGEGIFQLFTVPNRFPSFVIFRPDNGKLIECITLYRKDGTLEARIDPTKVGYEKYTAGADQYLIYPGSIVTDLAMPCGVYYLDIDGYCSELFTVKTSLVGLLRIQFRHDRDLGGIPYQTGFEQSIYLNTYLLEPEYKTDEEVEKNGLDIEIPVFQKLEKLYKLETLLIPEFVVDALQTLFLHKFIKITDVTGAIYDQLSNVEVKTDWVGSACFATTEISFVTASIISRHMEQNIALLPVTRVGEVYKPWICSNEPDPTPFWEADLTTVKCEQEVAETRISANRVAKYKDTNTNSITFGQYRDGGAFAFYDTNASACPIAIDNPPTIVLDGPATVTVGTPITLVATCTDDKTLINESVEFFYRVGAGAFISLGTAIGRTGDEFYKSYSPVSNELYEFRAIVKDIVLQEATSNTIAIQSSYLDNVIKVSVISTISGDEDTRYMQITAVLRDANGVLTTAPDNISIGYNYTFYGGSYPSGTGTLVVVAGTSSKTTTVSTDEPVSFGNAAIRPGTLTPLMSGGRTVET